MLYDKTLNDVMLSVMWRGLARPAVKSCSRWREVTLRHPSLIVTCVVLAVKEEGMYFVGPL